MLERGVRSESGFEHLLQPFRPLVDVVDVGVGLVVEGEDTVGEGEPGGADVLVGVTHDDLLETLADSGLADIVDRDRGQRGDQRLEIHLGKNSP